VASNLVTSEAVFLPQNCYKFLILNLLYLDEGKAPNEPSFFTKPLTTSEIYLFRGTVPPGLALFESYVLRQIQTAYNRSKFPER